jgi:nitroreductase
MNFLELIKTRRSIRQFKQAYIPEENLIDCIEAARLAPSAMNLQPLEYLLVTDKSQVAAIFPLLKWAGYIRPQGNPKANHHPVAYLIVLINQQIGKQWSAYDIGAAVENFMLAAWSKGIGSCWLASIARDAIRKIYQIPEHYIVDSIVALGYPAEKPVIEQIEHDIKYWKDDQEQLHVPKRSLDKILHLNKF